MVRGEKLDKSIGLLKQELALSPGRQDLDLELAQIYLRQQKFDLARQTLQPLQNAKDRELHKQAEVLLDSIKRYEEQMARYRSESEASNATKLRQQVDATSNAIEREQPPKSESDY